MKKMYFFYCQIISDRAVLRMYTAVDKRLFPQSTNVSIFPAESAFLLSRPRVALAVDIQKLLQIKMGIFLGGA